MAAADPNEVYLLRPLNTHPPTADDKRHSEELEEFLRSAGLYEPLEEAMLREDVLGMFYQLVQAWVKGVCRKKNFGVDDARAHVYTFGSYRLGVHGPGADMDTLVVGPRYVLRDSDFFGSEKHCLQYILTQTPDITDIQPVPDAFVPMIGIKYKGVQLDILYAALAMQTLPEVLDLSSHAVLRGCDEPTVRALNGCRVTDTMLQLVPRQDVFRTALRAVKHWAALRGISSNVTGYLGGVNLAIMVAKICQLYPKAEASTVLLKFFILLKAWPWPRAIHLRIPEDHSLGLPVWDPRPGTRDSLALMPVITPAYPAMNSLYNVQRSTLEVMTGEFSAAADTCTSFLHCPGGKPIDWERLFTPVPFFTQHTFYIQVEVSADSDHDLVLWDGWVSSRIRRLVRNLEDHVRVRPYPKSKKPPPPPAKDPDAAASPARPRLCYYIGIDKRLAATVTAAQLLPNGQVAQLPPHSLGAAAAAGAPAGKVDLKQPCTIFVNEVSNWPAKKPGMELKVNVLRKAQLPYWLLPDAQHTQQLALPAPTTAGEAGVAQRRQPDGKPVAAAIVASAAGRAAAAAVAQGIKRAASGEGAAKARQPPPLAKRIKAEQAPVPTPASRSPSPSATPETQLSGPGPGPGDQGGTAPGPSCSEGRAANGSQQGQAAAPLSVEAQTKLEAQASMADEAAAVQESQLHNTGRDMGDWLGVDHGVSLAGAQGSPAASRSPSAPG